MKCIARYLLVVFLLGIPGMVLPPGVSAAESGYVNVPLPDRFTPALEPDGSPRFISAEAIEKELRTYSPKMGKLYLNKNIRNFVVPDGDWLKHLLEIYDILLAETGLRAEADTWDCENFSSLLSAISTVSAWQSGFTDTKAALGWLRVDAREPWAGLPGAMHALMFAVTRKGIYIIEPQNGHYAPLAQYPNRQYIEEVYLF